MLSDAKEQHRAWELKQTFFDNNKKKSKKSKDREWEEEEEEEEVQAERRTAARRGRIFGPQHARLRGGGPRSKLFAVSKRQR
jgi:hypothetical protein